MGKSSRAGLVAVAAVLGLAVAPQAVAAPRHGTTRISTTVAGAQSATASAGGTISADGRYAVYGTDGPGGEGCPTAYGWCVLVKDLRTGRTVQVPGTGVEAYDPMISGDGSKVGYTSGTYHFFRAKVYDRRTGTLQTLWPADPPKDNWYERSDLTGLSADGRYAAYTIGNRDGNAFTAHLMVRDLTTGTDEVVDQPGHLSHLVGGRLSADGRYVAYSALDSDGAALYVKDRRTGRTRSIHIPAGGGSSVIDISADGRQVLFQFAASYPGTTTRTYLADTRTGRAEPVGPEGATALALDPTGRYTLLKDPTGALRLLDTRTGRQHTVAAASSAATAGPGALTRYGRTVVFASAAALVPGDTNGVSDVFARRIG
ncbi:WD40 repeat domain-containing protein [Streptomyces sp. NPDC046942]|uniref:WD40 repeat domain-containing protein n=1 Tax=Streptomyces sp. NPDC046942 TaxID=3155137 RepID=UPI0033DAF022